MVHSVHGKALAWLLMLSACGGGGAPQNLPDKPPNIVFILADDLDVTSAAQMVQVKALVTQAGAQFRQHRVSLSLCCPSRVTGLRGQFAHNTGIFKNGAPDGGFQATYSTGLENSTAATWLRGAGYRTAMFGKYLNGYPDTAPSATYIPPGWDEWISPNGGTPYKGFNYTMNENGSTVAYGDTAPAYITDVISARTTAFIRRAVADHPSQPFFAYVAPYAPHSPATPAPRHANTYPGAQAPRTASFDEADVSDKPSWVAALPRLTATQIDDIDALHRKRLQSLLAVDEMVKAIVDTLRDTGQLDNTYLFFASDNGYHEGQHRFESGKNTGYEEDLMVPLSVRGPGVPAGLVIDRFTANVDYAPTFADIAGIGTPSWVDGRSLLGLMQGQSPASWRQVLLLEHKSDIDDGLLRRDGTWEPADPFDLNSGTGDAITGFSGLRTADGYTYIEYENGERELYDNGTDAAQLRNAYATAPPALQARLTAWLASLKTAAGSGLRQAELAAP